MSTVPDLILHNGKFITFDRTKPVASAIAIKDSKFVAIGDDGDIVPQAGSNTRVVDLKGKSVPPGLIDNHTHTVRGGLNIQASTMHGRRLLPVPYRPVDPARIGAQGAVARIHMRSNSSG